MKLTAAERQTLHLALNLAIGWEYALYQATEPITPDEKKTLRECQRNIKKFGRLRDKLLGDQ
jgi:hypothetical protein